MRNGEGQEGFNVRVPKIWMDSVANGVESERFAITASRIGTLSRYSPDKDLRAVLSAFTVNFPRSVGRLTMSLSFRDDAF